ncbi:MAG: winged helix-turn-helix domain-containing protein [Chloracidobacterium sp.]|nr:winged helix-turn-helix domain-containing protein [Chloracidobacterium sp.]
MSSVNDLEKTLKETTSPHIYKFGEFQIDIAEEKLSKNGETLNINRRMFQVLSLMIERAGEIVSKEEFFEKVWAGSFVEDNNLTVAITGLRKVLGDDARQAKYIENRPRKGYRFIGEVQSIEPAPKILKSEPTVLPPPTAKAGISSIFKKPQFLTGILATSLLILLIVLVFNYRGGSTSANLSASIGQVSSIAVLPFENQNPDIEYLSDGLTDSIINNLAELPHLRVISRNSAFQYKNKELDLAAIGRDLNVGSILTGRIEPRGDILVITAELHDVGTKRKVWSQQYDRKLSETLAFQQEISQKICEILRTKLTSEEWKRLTSHQTDSSEAYLLYLKGTYHWNKRTIKDFEKAADFFNQAVDKDPTYALAYVGLANCYSTGDFSFINSNQDRTRIVLATVQKALDINGTLGEAYATRALVKTYYEWDRPGAEAEYKLAIASSPNYATAHHWYAEFLSMDGRFDESIAEYNRALEIDPLSLAIQTDLGMSYYYAHDFDRAIEQFEMVKAINPDYQRTYSNLFLTYREKGMFEESIASLEQCHKLQRKNLQITDVKLSMLSAWMQRLRNNAKASGAKGYWRTLIDFQIEEENGNPSPFYAASYHSKLGENDKALYFLEKAFKIPESSSLVWLKVTPEFDSIRPDPRFVDLMQRVGLRE